MSRPSFAYFAALLAAAPLYAQRPPLPVPLKLPPGLTQVLQVDKVGSYMGDAIRITDCPKNSDNPLGTCGNTLFGGSALYNTHLSGPIQIKFFPPIRDISRFEITHPSDLTGDDVLMRTPQFYVFAVNKNAILDSFSSYTSGDLNLTTGEVTNLNYGANFFNIFYFALGLVNPRLKPPLFTFPGVYGSAEAQFEQRPDGLLDFTFYGTTFLPLGNNIDGVPVRLPLPFCGPLLQCGSIQVPGLSLHPHLRITTKKNEDPPCGSRCPTIPTNTVIEMTLNSRFSSIGDNFTVNVTQLGGPATGRSQMQGRLQIQFGEQNGDYIPVAVNSMAPSGLLVPPPPLPIPGLSLGLLGHDEKLRFPSLEYDVAGVAILDDPFDFPVGEYNVKTGQFVGGLLWRSFWNTSLILVIGAANNGRIQPQSFLLRGPAKFEKGVNDQLVFRYNADEYRPYDGFTWPGNDYKNPAITYTAGPGSLLDPFFRMQAVAPGDEPTSLMTGSQTNVLSSYAERFTYNYSIPCNAAGKTGTFEYTNAATGDTGGTFKMDNLVSVMCLNSLTSTQPRGNYDTVTFTGFGSWSKDKDIAGLHVATVQISTAPSAPYVSILIDGGTVSNVNTKPAENPVP